MNTLTEFLASKEVLTVILIAVSICVIGTIYFVIEKIYKSKKIEQTNDMNTKIVRVNENQVVIAPIIEQGITQIKEKEVMPIVEENEKEIAPIVEEEKVEPASITTPTIEKKVPPVIPIEEFEKQNEVKPQQEVIEQLIMPSVENIYTEVKEQVEQDKASTEELIYTEIEPNQEEAKKELQRVTEELLKTQEMQQQENIDLTKFEEEQEENAIISMDELMKKSKVLYEQNEVTQYKDEGNEPISIADLEMRMNQIKVEAEELEKEEPIIHVTTEIPNKVKLDDFNTISLQEAYKEDRIFKSSPVISPIFGIEKESMTTNMELENTANYEKLDDEIKKTNEFLAVLKELQKKLD